MSTEVIQDVEENTHSQRANSSYRTVTGNRDTDVSTKLQSAMLPTRRLPVRFTGICAALRWSDLLVTSLIASYFLIHSGAGFLFAALYEFAPFALIPVVMTLSLRAVGAYTLGFNRSIVDHVLTTGYGAGIPLALLGIAISWMYADHVAPYAWAAIFSAWLVVNCVHVHVLVLGRRLARAGWISETAVIVGATDNAQRLIERNARSRELRIVGIFDDRLSRAPRTFVETPVLGRLDDLLDWDRLPEVDRLIVTVTSDARERVRDLVDRLRVLPQRVVLLLDLDDFDPETESLTQIAHSPAAYVSGSPHDARRAVSKRVFDFCLATLMLIALSPVMVALALAIRLDSKGPVFFRQKRQGFNNQIIKVWKFRSMQDDPDAEDRMTSQTLEDDPRITRLGRIIRQTSLDELPQLWNVIKGEMSIVGPRPHALGMTSDSQSVQNIVGDYAHRHRVKPGITGWAQINGSRGPVHTKDLVRERVRLDMEYVNRSSFWFDVYIILMTLPRLLGDARKVR